MSGDDVPNIEMLLAKYLNRGCTIIGDRPYATVIVSLNVVELFKSLLVNNKDMNNHFMVSVIEKYDIVRKNPTEEVLFSEDADISDIKYFSAYPQADANVFIKFMRITMYVLASHYHSNTSKQMRISNNDIKKIFFGYIILIHNKIPHLHEYINTLFKVFVNDLSDLRNIDVSHITLSPPAADKHKSSKTKPVTSITDSMIKAIQDTIAAGSQKDVPAAAAAASAPVILPVTTKISEETW